MRIAPQRRAIFRLRNFKKCSENVSFLAFWLQNVLLATTACNFSSLLWPHDSAPAALASLLFDSPDTRIIGKTQHFATSLTFGAGESSFFWLYFIFWLYFLLTFLHLSAFHLLFNSPYCRKFTILFKLPSTMQFISTFKKTAFPLCCHGNNICFSHLESELKTKHLQGLKKMATHLEIVEIYLTSLKI